LKVVQRLPGSWGPLSQPQRVNLLLWELAEGRVSKGVGVAKAVRGNLVKPKCFGNKRLITQVYSYTQDNLRQQSGIPKDQ